MFDKLEEVVARYEELNQMLVSPEVLADSKKMIECNKAINEITEIVEKYKEYKKYVDDIEFIKESFKTEKDPDMKEMLNEELKLSFIKSISATNFLYSLYFSTISVISVIALLHSIIFFESANTSGLTNI